MPGGLRARVIAKGSMARKCGALLGGGGKLLAEGHFNGLLAATDASPRELLKLKSKLGVDWVSQSLSQLNLARFLVETALPLQACAFQAVPDP